MKYTRLISVIVLVLVFFGLFFLIEKKGSIPDDLKVVYQGRDYLPKSKETILIEDIKDDIYVYNLGTRDKEAVIKLTKRQFPNDDYMLFVEAVNLSNINSVKISIPTEGKVNHQYKKNELITKLHPYRKPRALKDPLSTSLSYFQFINESILVGPQIYFNDISEEDKNGHLSKVLDFMREEEKISINEEGLVITIDFKGEEQFSTWFMFANEPLFHTENDFSQAYSIGVDEFRWITPDSLWSHGLTTIHPQSETAFIRSLVRQSGRSSSVQLQRNKSRFWENINRHQFASLELSRNKDGLWYTDYISTWLQNNYNIGAHYVDSRHNDNIFRSQLRRAELLDYTDYLSEIKVYADFLVEMADKGFTIEVDDYFYIIDYFDYKNKTHVSLNHALSIMNYLYDAYLYSEKEEYLIYAEKQLKAIELMENEWLDSDGEVSYQFNLDETVSAKDYNLVTYYDLLYTKKLRNQIGLVQSDTIENLIQAKQENLKKNNIPIKADIQNVEDYIGLIE